MDYKRYMKTLHELAMEKKAEREKKEEDQKRDGATTRQHEEPPRIGSQEYIDNLDIPGAMDDGVALLLYIVVMVVGIIFNDRWLIWIVATIVYLRHVFRRQIHKARWKREHKDK